MTNLRAAAQLALEAMDREIDILRCKASTLRAMIALRAALAQQAEPVEPVAWRLWDEDPQGGGDWRYYDAKDFKEGIDPMKYFDGLVPLYTTPPQRQSLAEWQINDLMAGIDPEDVCSWSFRQGVYAAEKHHGVKP